MTEMTTTQRRFNHLTVVTVLTILFAIATVVDALWNRSLWGLILGIPINGLMSYWVIGGCAHRGEPLARRIMRPLWGP